MCVADLSDGFAFVGQEPWIQYATVRDNILFGQPYNEDYYSQVIHACALEPVSEGDDMSDGVLEGNGVSDGVMELGG